jgi:hypothetical protein
MGRKRKYPDLPERSDPNYMKLYVEKNREKLHERGKTYRKERVENNPNHYSDQYNKYIETHRKYRIDNRELLAENQWKSRGIVDMTYNKYLDELKKQDTKCKICERDLNNPQVDHDHATGKYRGILCVPCNNGLGVYEKKKHLFEKYLKDGVSNEYDE